MPHRPGLRRHHGPRRHRGRRDRLGCGCRIHAQRLQGRFEGFSDGRSVVSSKVALRIDARDAGGRIDVASSTPGHETPPGGLALDRNQ